LVLADKRTCPPSLHAGTSKGGNPNWGDLEEDILEKDKEDPKEKSEDGRITSHIAEIHSHYNDKNERSDDQKDSDFPHAGLKPAKEGDEDGGVTTDEDDDKPQKGNKNPAPAALTIASDVFLEEYNKAFAEHNKIREDKSLSEEVRIVHLRKSKLRLNAFVRAKTGASSAAVSVSEPKSIAQASSSEEDERLKRIETGRRVLERLRASKEIAASTQDSSSNADEDWTSLGATFDRAASKPGAFQGIVNRLDKIPVLDPPATRRIVDVAADKDQWKEFLAGTDLQSAEGIPLLSILEIREFEVATRYRTL
jgi:hypothetical protein